jgi:hypothetical protein
MTGAHPANSYGRPAMSRPEFDELVPWHETDHPPAPRQSMLAKVRSVFARIDDSIFGDLIGGASLFALGYALFFVAGVFQ